MIVTRVLVFVRTIDYSLLLSFSIFFCLWYGHRNLKVLEAREILRAQLSNSSLPNNDNLVGGLDVLPFDNVVSVNIGSKDGVAILVPGPEISSGSIDIVAATCDVLEVSKVSNLPPASDNLVGGVDVLPIGTSSVFLECGCKGARNSSGLG